jgi:hypothetical protein
LPLTGDLDDKLAFTAQARKEGMTGMQPPSRVYSIMVTQGKSNGAGKDGGGRRMPVRWGAACTCFKRRAALTKLSFSFFSEMVICSTWIRVFSAVVSGLGTFTR